MWEGIPFFLLLLVGTPMADDRLPRLLALALTAQHPAARLVYKVSENDAS